MNCKPEQARYDGSTGGEEDGMGARVEKLMEDMVSQALTELTAIYNTRHAAIQQKQAQNE